MIPNWWVRFRVQGANVTLPDFYNTFDNLNTKRDAVLLKSKLTLDTTLKDPIWSQVSNRLLSKELGSRGAHALRAAAQLVSIPYTLCFESCCCATASLSSPPCCCTFSSVGRWYSQVVDTANWLESRRYSREIAANLIGGSMINEVLYRLFARINNRQPAAQRCLFEPPPSLPGAVLPHSAASVWVNLDYTQAVRLMIMQSTL